MKTKVIKTIGLMMAITLIGKILGLGRDMLFGYYYGTSQIADAFSLASLAPRSFFDIIFASALSASFIPVFNEYLEKKGRDAAYRLSNNFITLILISATAVTIISLLLAEPIVALLCAGYDAPTQMLTVSLLRIMLPIIMLSSVAFLLVGILQSLGEFNIPAAMSIVSNGIIILYYIFGIEYGGVYGLAIVFLIGWGAQILIQIPFLVKNQFQFRFIADVKDAGIKKIFKLMLPVMVSTWVQPINFLVNTAMATQISGGAAALNFANTLYTIITGVFILSVANIVFPELSKINARADSEEFGSTMRSGIRGLLFFLMPMCGGIMALAAPIVALIYQRGGFTSESTELTATALFYYSAGIAGYGLQVILSRGFYAMQKGLVPLVTGLVAIGINAAAGKLAIPLLGIGGPALASAIALNISALIMFAALYRINKGILTARMLADILLMGALSAIMGLAVYFLYGWLKGLFIPVISLCISVAAGVFIYMLGAKILNINEANIAFGLIRKYKRKGD